MMNPERETTAAPAPSDNNAENTANSTNELNEKRVFSDTPLKPSEQPAPAPAPEPEAKTIAFDRPAVLDEAYAARKAAQPPAPPAAAQRPAAPAAPVRRAARQRAMSGRLYSGETPKEAARRIIREFCVLLVFVLLVCGGFWAKDLALNFFTDDSYATIYQSTQYADPVACTGVSFTDATGGDGYAAAQVVCARLGAPIAEDAFAETGETPFPSEVAACMETALSAERVQLRTGLSNRDLLVRIYESLQAGRPVIVLLAGEDGGETQLQYALVTALSAEADTVSILRPGSGEETCSIEEFLAATRFETYDDMPFTVKLGLTFGSWSRNTAIFAE